MPNLQLTLPRNSFPGVHREELVHHLTQAAAEVEQIPDDPRQRLLCWVQVLEVETFACGGTDTTGRMLPCVLTVRLPAGVLDAGARRRYARRLHAALQRAQPADDPRQLVTSILIDEVIDGTWGVNGAIWHLPDFARAAGYRHLAEVIE